MTLPRKHWITAIGLSVLTLVMLRDALFLGGAYFERDLLSVYLPTAEAFARAVAEGAWPLRDPTSGFGQPILSLPDSEVLYPPTWLNLVMLPERAYPVIVLIHYLLGATGAAALAFGISRSRASSFFAGAFWLASGPLQSFLTLWHHLAGAAWMPWVLVGFDRLLERPDRRQTLILGAMFGLQILAGSPDMCAITLGLALLRLLCEPRAAADPRLKVQLSAIAAALLVAAGVGAVTWLGAAEVARASSRAALPEEVRTYWSVHPALLAEFVMPLNLGALKLVGEARQLLYDGREPFVKSLFLGPLILPLFLAALVSGSLARKYRVFAGAAVLVSLLLSLGKHSFVYGLVTTLAPVLQVFRFPSKLTIPASLFLCVMGGVGLSQLQNPRPRSVARVTALALLILHGVVFFLLPMVLPLLVRVSDPDGLRLMAQQAGIHIMISAGSLMLVILALLSGRRRFVIGAATIGLLATLGVNSGLNPVVARSVLRFRPETVSLLKTAEPSRLYASDYVHAGDRTGQPGGPPSPFAGLRLEDLPPSVAYIVGVRSTLVPPGAGVWGIEYAWDRDLRGLFRSSLRLTTAEVPNLEGSPKFLRLLQLANVSHVAAMYPSAFRGLLPERTDEALVDAPVHLFTVPGSLPRAYLVSGVRVLDDESARREMLDPDFRLADEVILDDGVATAISPGFRSSVRIESRRSDRVELQVDLSEAGTVVLLEGFLPGWKATVDGTPTPLRRANALFVAASVPSGSHRVVFSYLPWTAVAGVSATFLTTLLVFLGLARARRESGPTGSPGEDPRAL